ncbi:unnamed protein product [Parajaminaea phylloscopi]
MPRQQGKRPVAASKDAVAAHVARRQQKRQQANAGPSQPKSIHDVYDFAVNREQGKREGSRNKATGNRILKRAQTGEGETLYDGASKRSAAGRANSSDDSDSDGRSGPAVFDDSDDESGKGKVIAEEDDSEIDSDEAFDESDEERYEGYAFASDRRKRGVDSDMESDDLDESEEAGMIDLSNMLDNHDDNGSESSSQDSDESEDDAEPASEDEAKDARLGSLVQSYAQPSAKRAVATGDANLDEEFSSSKKRRRVLPEKTESMAESDFAAPRTSAMGTAVGLEDLLAPLAGSTAGELSQLRESTRALRSVEQGKGKGSGSRQPIASKRGGGALAAPLPDVVKDRMQRSAGYEMSKEEAEKWKPTIKRLREAEHLSFPLQAPPSRPRATTAQMTSTFKPGNALEADINSLLEAEGLSEKQIAQSEELAMRKLDPEEAKRRREELRKMRELMFRAEQKAKRVSKIKSKTYRKIARKDKERQDEKLRAAGLLDDDVSEDDEEEQADRIVMERDRAKERATLKHKNTGKWARNVLGKKDLMADGETREAIDEQLKRSDQLRRRMEGLKDSTSDEDESDYSGEEEDDPRRAAFDELRALDARESRDADAGAGPSGAKKGVWNMKFMQDARHRSDAAAEQERNDFEADLKRMEREEAGDSDDSSSAAGEEQAVIGRRVFAASESGPSKSTDMKSTQTLSDAHIERSSMSGDEGSDSAGAVVDKTQSIPSKGAPKAMQSRLATHSAAVEDSDGTANPWLTGSARSQRGKPLATTSSSAATKSASKLEKRKNRAQEVVEEAENDARVEIDPSAVLTGGSGIAASRSVPSAASSKAQQNSARPATLRQGAHAGAGDVDDGEDDDEDEEDEDEPTEMYAPGRRANKQAFSQRDLIAEAFAGDDVAADFAAEKARIAAEDAPKEIDNSLPGWGSWGGKGVKTNRKSGAAKRKEAELKRQHTIQVPGLDVSKRKDAGVNNVIINERKDKKASKYLVKDLPYPYTSARQYNATREQPLGPEWNTLTQKQRLTMPRVLATKPGAVIKPIQRL